ncbi:putative ATP-dependent RNA helicase RhlE [Streptomyces aurantiacus JA 4570]|uniref:Putative ATP-dependent RNA helicase RhlE n=1 Tax=Streptomyces aurantiacus JA 4570 TaxID=1286094 RepID=S3ZDC3_9ACTN|nr:putative ATP-dependent RNA helicase RhlE [Streptomyces aurantiacus JA 4570]
MARGVDARVLHEAEDLAALVRQGEGDDGAAAAGAGGTARAVQVVLVVARRVHVQDQVDAVDVDAAGGDVGGDQGVDVALLEVREDARTGALRHAAVQRVGLHTGVAELLGDAVGAQLGAYEDDGAALAGGDRGGDRRLVAGLHDQDVVRHGRDVALGAVDLVRHRVVQVALDQRGDLVLHRGGEQHALAAGRDLVEQLGDLGQEAQVGHLVGLVEDRDLDVLQGAGAAVDDVAQPARGGDEDVDAALEGVDLVAHRRTAADDLHLQAEHVAVRLQGVRDLHGELTGRGEDDAAGLLLVRVTAGQGGEQRQAEGEGLAGAGAAAAQDVLAGQGVRDGRGLDREGGVHAVARELADDAVGETEVGEGEAALFLGVVGGVGSDGAVFGGVRGGGLGGLLGRVGGLGGRGLVGGRVLCRLGLLGGDGVGCLGLGHGRDLDELGVLGLVLDLGRLNVKTGNGHAKCETFRSLGTRPQLRDFAMDRLYAVSHGKGEYAPRGALFGGAGQMGSNDLPPYAPPTPIGKRPP